MTETRTEALLSLEQVREALANQMSELQAESKMLRQRVLEVEYRVQGIKDAQAALERLALKASKDAP